MPRRTQHDDPWNEDFDSDEDDPDFDDDDDGDDYDLDSDDTEPTIDCPYCRREIHENAQWCPYCDQYISEEDAPRRKPWWIVVGVMACLFVVYLWLFG